MTTDDDPGSSGGDFDVLTAKQAAVLDQLARGLTSKEIADRVQSSESAVNRHIEILRARAGGITRAQLAQRFRERIGAGPASEPGHDHSVESTKQIIDLADAPVAADERRQDNPHERLAFRDSVTMRVEAPWMRPDEPRVVPRVLDGDHAALARGTMIAILLAAIIASLVLGLAAALAITDALGA